MLEPSASLLGPMAQALSPEKYTVGWICPLAKEFTAGRAMFDEFHDDLQSQNLPHDSNRYALGKIGSYNAVMACLPAGHIGTSLARDVAGNMRRSFPNIRYFLLVGIGGGVPSYGPPGDRREIVLGDVVVGTGIVQTGFGAHAIDGFRITRHLYPPPMDLLNAVTWLRSDHEMKSRTRMPQFIECMLENIAEEKRGAYRHQGNDRLYQAHYPHQRENWECEECCDPQELVGRSPRKSTGPEVHYGFIASADHLMVNAVLRDKLQAELQVICFEMEAAGLNMLPFLAIRGICDYADSHKNKKWQEYAAATAAAYTKELLYTIPQSVVGSQGNLGTRELHSEGAYRDKIHFPRCMAGKETQIRWQTTITTNII